MLPMDYPLYSYPPHLALGLIINVLFGGRRSFHRDGLVCLERIKPSLRVSGQENIPQAGPCLLTFNHYFRPGFNAWWMALSIASVVPQEIHFVMTGELTYPGKWYAPLGRSGSRWLLKRFSNIYGFTTMPPMPPRSTDVEARSRSVRAVLAYARSHPQAFLGLAPEGGDQPGGVLNWPPAGAGRSVLILAEQGFPIQPVGCFEEAGTFCLHFGVPFWLDAAPGLCSDEKDRRVSRMVMSAIAAQLPDRLRGDFK
jgi:hypothetical protein